MGEVGVQKAMAGEVALRGPGVEQAGQATGIRGLGVPPGGRGREFDDEASARRPAVSRRGRIAGQELDAFGVLLEGCVPGGAAVERRGVLPLGAPFLGDAVPTPKAAHEAPVAMLVGPILLGAAKPVHILTPSATVRRIINITALTVVEAGQAG